MSYPARAEGLVNIIRDKYVIALRNKFDVLQAKTETRTPNDEYENFVNAYLDAPAKYIPTKHRTKSRAPWETLADREKRADVKTASKFNRKNPTNANALNNILRKNQIGFRRNRSTTSQILTISKLLEGIRAKNLQVTI